jgi:flagellar protein FlaG
MNILSTNIQTASSAAGAGLPTGSNKDALTAQAAVIQPPQESDAQVVAKVASTEIKPSNVAETAKPTQQTIAQTAQQLQEFVQSMGRNLSFSVDSTTGYDVVVVTNPSTGQVVRQLPSEELLKIAQTMDQNSSGLVNQKA